MRFVDAGPPSRGAGADDEGARLLRALVAELDREVEDLDAATLGRLRAARRTALGAAGPRRRPAPGAFGTGALGGTVAVAALALAVWTVRPIDAPDAPIAASASASASASAPAEAPPVVTAGEDLEFYRSVDFLLWLEARSERG